MSEESNNRIERGFQKRFLVYDKNCLRSIEVTDIYLFYHEEGVTFIVTFSGETLRAGKSLNNIEERLNKPKFFRINRNMILSFDGILKIEPYFGNRLVVLFKTEIKVKAIVSRDRVFQFKKWLGA